MLTSLLMMSLSLAPPTKIIRLEIYPIQVNATPNSYSIEKFCVFYHLSNGKVGKRRNDPLACATIYTEQFTITQRRLNKSEQAMIDRECIHWNATGGRVVPYGCDTSSTEP